MIWVLGGDQPLRTLLTFVQQYCTTYTMFIKQCVYVYLLDG